MNKAFSYLVANRPLQWFLIAVAVLALVYWYGKSAITDTMKYDTPLPNSGSGIPQGWDPNVQADALFDVLDGLFTTSTDKEFEIVKCKQLTNDQLVAVYRTFNRKYCPQKSDGTMTQWLKDERYLAIPSVRSGLVARLISLNCR